MPWKPDYLSAEDAAEYVHAGGDDGGTPADAAELAVWCTAASRAIDTRCNRQFGNVDEPVVRTYRRPAVYSRHSGLWTVEIDDVRDGAGMTVNGVPFADSGAVLLPDNAPADAVPYERFGFTSNPGGPLAVVSEFWGWAAFPAGVVGATRLQVSRWNARRNSPYGIAGSPESGGELRLLARLDPDVSTTLAGLSRRRRVG